MKSGLRAVGARIIVGALIVMLVAPGAESAPRVRIKEVAHLQNVRENQLVGYGIVVGLAGTGDGNKAVFTVLSVLSMLEKLGISLVSSLAQYGIEVDGKSITTKNLAAVIVTATLPAFASSGQRIDVTTSAIGDAESLKGGVLLQTPLLAGDGKIYAVAQGPISLGGGEGLGGAAAAGAGSKKHETSGRIANGALIERDLTSQMISRDGSLTWVLNRPDFASASRLAESINAAYDPPIAIAESADRVKVALPTNYRTNPVPFIARIEDLLLTPDEKARVIINERTGTIVFGENVALSPVAISHGGLTISIKAEEAPNAAAGSGPAAATVSASEDKENTMFFPQSTTIKDVVRGLNAIGAQPHDIIAIIQAIAEAGALHAEIEFI